MKRSSVNGCENNAVLMLLEEATLVSILRLLKRSHFLFVNYLLGKSGRLYAPCEHFTHMYVSHIFSYRFCFHVCLTVLLTFILFFSSSPSLPCHYFHLYPHFHFVILIYFSSSFYYYRLPLHFHFVLFIFLHCQDYVIWQCGAT